MTEKKPETLDSVNKNSLVTEQEYKPTSKLSLPPALTVKQLAERIGISAIEVIKQLMRQGVMVNINQAIDFETATIIAEIYGFEAQKQAIALQAKPPSRPESIGKLAPRPPVITILGHVDHGKTSLLDAIRESNIIASEAGDITQHIGAYQVEVKGKQITFLDTPGHQAFTAMRARGARSTDIAILLVAADDGVMPQTIEAMNHALAAEVPIVVTINKIDKANANPDRVKQQLADLGLLIEEWGGDIICVSISAKKRQGIEELLDNLLLLAEILELKVDVDCPAEGVVIEARLDKTKGPLATLLVQKGNLKIGDTLVTGQTCGKVKAMFSDTGKQLKKAGPATPVEVLGLNTPPQAGETFEVVPSEREARAVLQKRQDTQQYEFTTGGRTLTLSDLSNQISAGNIKDLNIVLKTDVQGSIEPIKDSLEKLSDEKLRVRVIHSGTGSITQSDVLLALASKGLIIGFNSRPEPGAQRLAEAEGISIRHYNIIYDIVSDVEKALKGMLEPTITEVIDGEAEVIAVFEYRKKAKIAGVKVLDGKLKRDSLVRLLRQGEVIHESRVHSLRRFKDDVKEAAAGMECGVTIDNFTEFQIGDILKFYRQEKVA